MFLAVEPRAKAAFVMAYNSALVHLVPTGGPYRTNVFRRARKLLVFRGPWVIDSDSVWEATTLRPFYGNALGTLPDRVRVSIGSVIGHCMRASSCSAIASAVLLKLPNSRQRHQVSEGTTSKAYPTFHFIADRIESSTPP